MKVYASISGGKDSLAALITHMERGGQCDGAIYCRIMFDDETSAEVPEHEEWLHSKCFPLLEREYGIKTQIVQGKYTYTDCFYKRYEKGGKVGKIWGFPFLRGAWCNTRLKVRPIQAHIKALGEFTEIVGIAADETNRIERKTVAGKILPLVECGITEAQAFDVCRSRGLLSPGYNGGRERLGCWFCHNQRVGELKRLYYDYPELWNKLAKLDRDSPVTFKPGKTLAAFLGTIPAIETPWDDAFHRLYCSSCSAADCDDCRRPERDSPLWWLGLPAAEAEK